jgi:hypothetical protein
MRIVIGLLLLHPLLFISVAQADSMRCGTQLVGDGDTQSEVRQLCGEPTDVQTRSIVRQPHHWIGGRLIYFNEALVEVPVEVWTYNFGPYKLMRRVRFIDGLIDEIETLGYGYHEKQGEK